MSRFALLLFVVTVGSSACGGKSSPPPTTPLPADKPPETAAPAPAPEPAPAPAPQPAGPVEVTVKAAPVTVKLVSAGKGKKAPLRYTVAQGARQKVELAMDFTAKQVEGGNTQEQIVPTVILVGTSEAQAVAADGTATYLLTVESADARDVKGSQVPAEKFRTVLGALAGLTIGSSVAANGTAGDVMLRIEKPTELSSGAVDLVRLTMPTFPVLPTQPVGVGAKWQTTTQAKLADKLDITEVTDYVLVARKGTTWTIKGTTKVSGADQKHADGPQISAIKGAGTSEATFTTGTLYPAYKSSVETSFTASEQNVSVQFALKIGGAVTPSAAAAPATGAAPTTGAAATGAAPAATN